jgi:hypothetical protein
MLNFSNFANGVETVLNVDKDISGGISGLDKHVVARYLINEFMKYFKEGEIILKVPGNDFTKISPATPTGLIDPSFSGPKLNSVDAVDNDTGSITIPRIALEASIVVSLEADINNQGWPVYTKGTIATQEQSELYLEAIIKILDDHDLKQNRIIKIETDPKYNNPFNKFKVTATKPDKSSKNSPDYQLVFEPGMEAYINSLVEWKEKSPLGYATIPEALAAIGKPFGIGELMITIMGLGNLFYELLYEAHKPTPDVMAFSMLYAQAHHAVITGNIMLSGFFAKMSPAGVFFSQPPGEIGLTIL